MPVNPRKIASRNGMSDPLGSQEIQNETKNAVKGVEAKLTSLGSDMQKLVSALGRINANLEQLKALEASGLLLESYSVKETTKNRENTDSVKKQTEAQIKGAYQLKGGMEEMAARNEAGLRDVSKRIILLHSFLQGDKKSETQLRLGQASREHTLGIMKHRSIRSKQLDLLGATSMGLTNIFGENIYTEEGATGLSGPSAIKEQLVKKEVSDTKFEKFINSKDLQWSEVAKDAARKAFEANHDYREGLKAGFLIEWDKRSTDKAKKHDMRAVQTIAENFEKNPALRDLFHEVEPGDKPVAIVKKTGMRGQSPFEPKDPKSGAPSPVDWELVKLTEKHLKEATNTAWYLKQLYNITLKTTEIQQNQHQLALEDKRERIVNIRNQKRSAGPSGFKNTPTQLDKALEPFVHKGDVLGPAGGLAAAGSSGPGLLEMSGAAYGAKKLYDWKTKSKLPAPKKTAPPKGTVKTKMIEFLRWLKKTSKKSFSALKVIIKVRDIKKLSLLMAGLSAPSGPVAIAIGVITAAVTWYASDLIFDALEEAMGEVDKQDTQTNLSQITRSEDGQSVTLQDGTVLSNQEYTDRVNAFNNTGVTGKAISGTASDVTNIVGGQGQSNQPVVIDSSTNDNSSVINNIYNAPSKDAYYESVHNIDVVPGA